MRQPRICCVDLDTFFVSVERLLDPSLRGKAVIIGGEKGGRGVVTSASYEARAFGVRSGISIRDATKLVPDAVFVPGHHDAYAKYSTGARQIVERFSPVVVAASIDEQFVDFHGCEGLYRGDEQDHDRKPALWSLRTRLFPCAFAWRPRRQSHASLKVRGFSYHHALASPHADETHHRTRSAPGQRRIGVARSLIRVTRRERWTHRRSGRRVT